MPSTKVYVGQIAFLGIYEVPTGSGPILEATWLRGNNEDVMAVGSTLSEEEIESIRYHKECELLANPLPRSEGRWIKVRAVPYRRDLHPHEAFTGHEPTYQFGRLCCCK